jgi:large subunit ribosomal protein L15
MIKTHKRKKRSRLRGSKTAFWGARKKHKDSGHKGGKGMAGTGKRSGHKKTLVLAKYPGYLGKKGFKSKKIKLNVLNLEDISKRIVSFLDKKKAKKKEKGIELNFPGYKILGRGEIKEKIILKADEISDSAKEKIIKAGGEVIVKEKRKKPDKKSEKQ